MTKLFSSFSRFAAPLFALIALLAPQTRTQACTNILVTPGASCDSSSLVSYAADSHKLYGELYFSPAADWKAGTMRPVRDWDSNRPLGEIPQVPHTYQRVGNMNEHQLIVTETTWGGRAELEDKTGGIDYGTLIYAALERARTAREAIEVIVSLANEHGYASEGETFSLADPKEVWIMDLIGKGTPGGELKVAGRGIVWVARRVPDGAICAHANQARIGIFPLDDPENCLYAPDVVEFARRCGFYAGADKDFSFKKAYGPADASTIRGCDARVWSAFNRLSDGKFIVRDERGKLVWRPASDYVDYAMGKELDGELPLWIFPSRKLDVKDIADAMRDHYEGTPMDMSTDIGAGGNALPYRWRPMGFEVDGKSYVNERAIATQQTGFWLVGQARSRVPAAVGGILWFGTDDAATSYLTPIYTRTAQVPPCFRVGNGDLLHYSEDASFWINNRVANACYKMYNVMAPFVRERIDAFESSQLAQGVPAADSAATAILAAASPKGKGKADAAVVRLLTDYTVQTAQTQFQAWRDLEVELLVKFIDGNVKPQREDGSFLSSPHSAGIPDTIEWPGYTDHWKRSVVRDHGETLRLPDE